MYCNERTYEIRYTDVDAYDIIKASALLGIMQESACVSADELKFGYDDIKDLDIGFILSAWYVKIFRPIRYGEKITVRTWPLRPTNVIFLREFELYAGDEKVGAATARWCMVDLKSFKILPSDFYFKNYDFSDWNTARAIDFNAWKIRDTAEESAYCHEVGYADYDHYFHVNNTRYADIAMNAFSAEDFKDKFISGVQVNYVKQCKAGEKLALYKSCGEAGYYVEGRVGEEKRVQIKFTCDKII